MFKPRRAKSKSSATVKKTTKPTRPQTGHKKRRGPLPSESAMRHTSQKPPLEREVVDLLARRLWGASRLRILTGILAGLIGLAFGTATFGQIGPGPATPPPMPQGPSESMERAEKDQMKKQTEKKKRAAKPAEKAKERAEEKK